MWPDIADVRPWVSMPGYFISYLKEKLFMFGFELIDFFVFVGISLMICITVCTLAMEAAVIFVPAFIFLFPRIVDGFPTVSPNEAIGLAITVEVFGYTSSVLGYWFRRQVDLRLSLRLLAITVPAAIIARIAAFFLPEDGLLIIFGIVLLGLAAIIYRSYRGEVRHTCLLCGDSIAAMRMGDDNSDNPVVANPDSRADRVKKYPDIGRAINFNLMDKSILTSAGLFAGITGVAIGEISNTFLSIRKKVPVKISTGTAALVLHITILSALCANLTVLFGDIEFIDVEEIVIPWKIAFILAPVVILGGQIGSMINSRLSDKLLLKLMMIAYTIVGLFVLFNTLGELM